MARYLVKNGKQVAGIHVDNIPRVGEYVRFGNKLHSVARIEHNYDSGDCEIFVIEEEELGRIIKTEE